MAGFFGSHTSDRFINLQVFKFCDPLAVLAFRHLLISSTACASCELSHCAKVAAGTAKPCSRIPFAKKTTRHRCVHKKSAKVLNAMVQRCSGKFSTHRKMN